MPLIKIDKALGFRSSGCQSGAFNPDFVIKAEKYEPNMKGFLVKGGQVAMALALDERWIPFIYQHLRSQQLMLVPEQCCTEVV